MSIVRAPAPTAPASRARAGRHEQDTAAVLLVARGRVLLATALVLGGSLLSHRAHSAEVLLAVGGYLWVPFAAVLALVAGVRTVRIVRVLGAVGDLGMLFALHTLIGGSATIAFAGYSVVVVLGAYTGGRRFGLNVAAAAMALVLLGERLAPEVERAEGAVVALFSVTLALLLVVVDRAASEQRRAEARSAHLATKADAILERIADGVVVTDAAGLVVEANPAAEQLVGTRSLSGRSCGEVLSLCSGERKLDCSSGCGLLALAASEPTPLGHEVWRARGDGTRQPVLANASPVRDEHGAVVEVVHSLRDITRLKQADEAKTLFLATASHELKTPLTVIRGFAETLQRNNVPDEVRRRGLEAIARRAHELTGIVERLLLSSRIEAGRLTVKTAPVDAVGVIRERIETMAAATRRAIELSAEENLPLVFADGQAIATIIDHLVDNAIKYSPDGASSLVSVSRTEAHVRIDVTDFGIGMDEDQSAHCFEKFWQADSTDGRSFGGTGIGLYIVASLAESMGGKVDVQSAVGAGCTFRVYLRRADVAPDGPYEGDGSSGDVAEQAGVGERSMVREFMRQLGVPAASGGPRT